MGHVLEKKNYINLLNVFNDNATTYGSRYSRMDQVKIVEDSL